MLLEHGADVDKAETTTGATPLSVASWEGHADKVEMLIGAGASTSVAVAVLQTYITSQPGFLPPHIDSIYCRAVQLLAMAGADLGLFGDMQLQLLAARSFPATVAWVRSARGLPPLRLCASLGSERWFRWLLRRGAQAAATMHHGWTALLVAALHGRAACVRLLCESGADVDGGG